ncbi:polymer-forming cytoskeletal protein [Bacillus sp. EB106-08-02-XG196]|jgi:cytoskeletal protein CcmA (bactofilin family)|uniref:polymer-forming cytoskeletal protein n=1 Tax=Bacillus sp. EB106-08-02-XG196 TaxID=2737049 RepID=UPI0015C4A5B6|nr:polymer-forming cytoskeletal protein [Bacillus sp. EB106-08-02-XG196]NWQ43700.1 polymer-forming cytoskeletal protein [Bacillus sp. EB106-08-02-XG196]
METKKRGDLLINGLGSSNGGSFNSVSINGKGSVTGDVECSELDFNGSGSVAGNVVVNHARINGRGKINGNMESQILTVDGTAGVTGNLLVKKLKVSGKANVGGKIKGDEIKIRGRLTVGEDCEAETFKAESQFSIGGLLNADLVDITIFADCHAKEIGGQTILIKQKNSLLGYFKPFVRTQLKTECIEGDKIEIENTKAGIVRGKNVVVGANCEIDVVEYSGEFTMDKNSIVKDIRKI